LSVEGTVAAAAAEKSALSRYSQAAPTVQRISSSAPRGSKKLTAGGPSAAELTFKRVPLLSRVPLSAAIAAASCAARAGPSASAVRSPPICGQKVSAYFIIKIST